MVSNFVFPCSCLLSQIVSRNEDLPGMARPQSTTITCSRPGGCTLVLRMVHWIHIPAYYCEISRPYFELHFISCPLDYHVVIFEPSLLPSYVSFPLLPLFSSPPSPPFPFSPHPLSGRGRRVFERNRYCHPQFRNRGSDIANLHGPGGLHSPRHCPVKVRPYP